MIMRGDITRGIIITHLFGIRSMDIIHILIIHHTTPIITDMVILPILGGEPMVQFSAQVMIARFGQVDMKFP